MKHGKDAPFFVDREEIVLTQNGVWLADGNEISHEPTRQLFARSIKKNNEGYFLSIGKETKRIHVEDTAYFVLRVDGQPPEPVHLTLSDTTQETLIPSTLAYRPGRLTCMLKRGEEAKFLHAPYFDLLRHLREDASSYYLEWTGKKVVLARK